MAGSLRNYIYETDITDGAGGRKIIVLNVDESNAIAVGGVVATPANLSGKVFANAGQDFIRFTPRYLLLEGETSGGRPVRRKMIALNPENTLFLNGGTTVSGVMVTASTAEAVTFTVTGTVGEKRTFPRTTDSGLDDGTPA